MMSLIGSKFLSYCDSPVLHIHSRAERAEFTPQPIQSMASVLQLQHRCSLKCVVLVSFSFLFFFSVNICAFKTLLSFSFFWFALLIRTFALHLDV